MSGHVGSLWEAVKGASSLVNAARCAARASVGQCAVARGHIATHEACCRLGHSLAFLNPADLLIHVTKVLKWAESADLPQRIAAPSIFSALCRALPLDSSTSNVKIPARSTPKSRIYYSRFD